MTRENIPKRIRFEVFKRDSFTCQYCGAKAPDVILEVDHIQPVAKGGKSDLLNLTTACRGCNSGKSDRELSDNSVVEKQRRQLAELQERKEQIEMMLEWQKGLSDLDSFTVDQIADFWADLVSPYRLNERGKTQLGQWLPKFGASEVMEAMRIAVRQYVEHDANGVPAHESVNEAWGKVGGICAVRKGDADRPGLKDVYYIRGILRHRVGYVNEEYALGLLRRCVALGANLERLKDHVREVGNWTQWRSDLEEFVRQKEGQLGTDDAGIVGRLS